jgi:ligand-binding sensor domain-containing protein
MRAPRDRGRTGIAWILVSLALAGSAAAQAGWRLVKPSNTGIPGEEVRIVRFAPDGNLWVGARWPFWQEGGFGIYDFAADAWTTQANWETPLPSEYVNDLEFEADGTAWIATDRGLVKLDGQTWSVWDPSNSPLQRYEVGSLSLAPNGHVWVNNSHFSAGLDAIYDFDGVSSWERFAVPAQLPWPSPWTDLSDVLAASDGTVWVANDTLNGLAEYDGSGWTLHGAGVGRFTELKEDLDGNIWMRAGVGGGNTFWKFDRTSFTAFPAVTTTTSIGIGNDGAVYLGDWFGNIRKTVNGGQTWTTYLSGLNRVTEITPDPASTDMWIGTAGAVGHFTGAGGWVRDYNSHNTGFPYYWVDAMCTDRDGLFWVATGEMGLSRFDGVRWRNWGEHNAGSEPWPFAGNEPMGGVYQDTSGMHWFGGNGIARWDSVADEFTGFWNWQNNPGIGVTLFLYFAEDASGRLFAATKYGSIYHFDEAAQLWVKEPVQPYAVLGLPGMAADSLGNVWIAGWFDIHRWDGVEWSTVALPNPNYFFDLGGISDLAIASDDVMWLGTGGGLVRWDGVDFTLFDQGTTPIPDDYVTGVDVRADGLIGLAAASGGSSSGAAVIDGDPSDPAAWTVFPYGPSILPHWQLGTVAFDAAGDLWVSALSEAVAVYRHERQPETFCTAGVSASGCRAMISASGTPSATAGSGFDLAAANAEGSKDGLFFFGANGRQANPWGNGTSFQCVVPPVTRAGLQVGVGTNGLCDGAFLEDLNALWCPTCPRPNKNPGAGALVQAQLWYRDPLNTSNRTTSLSDAIEFAVAP